ncbi:MAG: tRNA lysidine(34) synthetase TilS, partial [Rhodanobacter sp.]
TLHDPHTDTLCAADWLALDPALRQPLLDHWLHRRGLPAPTTAQRRQIERQCHARIGQQPCIRWPGAEVHIWKGRLWALPLARSTTNGWSIHWHGAALELPDGGQLQLSDSSVRLSVPLEVRQRRGGEHIKPAGDRHTRELRDLFQQGRVPPWQRENCPLLYADGELIAVADRWINARGMALFERAGALPRWLPAR